MLVNTEGRREGGGGATRRVTHGPDSLTHGRETLRTPAGDIRTAFTRTRDRGSKGDALNMYKNRTRGVRKKRHTRTVETH